MNGVLVYGFSRKGEELTVTRQVVAVDGQELNAYSAAGSPTSTATAATTSCSGGGTAMSRLYLQGLDGQFLRERPPELAFGDAYINALAVVESCWLKQGERALVIESSDGKATPGSVRAFVVRRGPLTKPAAAR